MSLKFISMYDILEITIADDKQLKDKATIQPDAF